MARKSIKKEPVAQEGIPDAHSTPACEQSQQFQLSSSGDTVVDTVVDTDVVMHEDLGQNRCINFEANGIPETRDRGTNGASQYGYTRSSDTVAPDACRGLEILGRGVKELVQAVQDLRHLGVEDLVLPLPKIVVVGDQSTGKSSLIEGIRQCPMEINLSENTNKDDPWECRISLYKKYLYETSQRRSQGSKGLGRTANATARIEGATKQRPLGPWIVQESEDAPFATTFEKDKVADLLEWAQIATLNPGSSYDNYMPHSTSFKDDRTTQVKFSPNVVRIDIAGPGLPNLSFYDLPGVINVSDVESEEYLVHLVRNLVKEYIKADNCINLLALPMTDDLANSSASRIIREEKAEARTIGVLTKPDRIQDVESIEQWVHILNGERFRLGHGYYIVRNNPDTSVDHITARMQEHEFFENTEPWASTLKQYDQRFGTLQLQAALSHKLTAQIRASLPHFTEQVERKVDEINRRLKALPETPAGNLPLKVLERMMLFENEIQKHLDGGMPGYTFQMEWHDLVEQFRKILMDSRPLLMQRDLASSVRQTIEDSGQATPTPARKPIVSVPINLDSDDDNSYATPLPNRSSKKRINGATPNSTPYKKARISDIPLYAPKKGLGKTSYSRSFSLNEVGRCLREAHIGLPGQIDPKATNRMIYSSMEVWGEPLDHLLESSITMCQTLVSQQIDSAFVSWQQTLLHSRTREICAAFFDRVVNGLRITVANIYQRELRKPTMSNKETLAMANEKALSMLKARRREYMAAKFIEDQDSADKTPNRQNKVDRMSKVTDAQLGPDPYSQEVLAMSCVKAYYDCVYPRFADAVYQAIACELFDTCRNELGNMIKEELHVKEVNAHEECAILLAINPEQERQRHQLLKEKDTLEKARERLQGLAGAASNADE